MPSTTALALSPSSEARSISSATCCTTYRQAEPLSSTPKPAGILAYHNTLIAEQTASDPYSNAHFRNNLFLGRDTPNRGIMTWANATVNYSSDYNGYRPNRGVTAQYKFLAPGSGKTAYEPKDSEWRSFA